MGLIRRLSAVTCLFAAWGFAVPVAIDAHAQAPLPRFASLAGSTINVRTGPGKQYPVRWIYERPGYPVQIVDEFDVWRKIVDPEGDGGWVHTSLLSARRTVLITHARTSILRTASADARAVAHTEAGVVGRILECDPIWCFVEVDDHRGWIDRTVVWGVLPDEAHLDLD